MEAVTMLGCPEPAESKCPGRRKPLWVLPSCTARRHPGFAASLALFALGKERKEEMVISIAPQTALHPWKVLLGPYGLAANGHFSTQQHFCRLPPLLLAARGPSAPVLPAQASLAGFLSVPAGSPGAAGMEQGLSPSPPAGTSRAVDFSTSADYGSEVNSHVAKLPLLWER